MDKKETPWALAYIVLTLAFTVAMYNNHMLKKNNDKIISSYKELVIEYSQCQEALKTYEYGKE